MFRPQETVIKNPLFIFNGDTNIIHFYKPLIMNNLTKGIKNRLDYGITVSKGPGLMLSIRLLY
jgi:hypothetical protein